MILLSTYYVSGTMLSSAQEFSHLNPTVVLRSRTIIISIYHWGNWGFERHGGLFKVILLADDRDGFGTREILFQSWCHELKVNLCKANVFSFSKPVPTLCASWMSTISKILFHVNELSELWPNDHNQILSTIAFSCVILYGFLPSKISEVTWFMGWFIQSSEEIRGFQLQ